MSENKQLTQRKYQCILNALESKIYGTFEIKHLVSLTGYKQNIVREAIKRLKEEGKIVPHTKTDKETIYIKAEEKTKERDIRFDELTKRAKEVAGDLGFTAVTIAKVLKLSQKEGDKWFREALQKGILVNSAGPWARFKEQEILT
ncbi:MAG: hypothetical protein ACRD38_01505 [Nitrososphaerales archaeon]